MSSTKKTTKKAELPALVGASTNTFLEAIEKMKKSVEHINVSKYNCTEKTTIMDGICVQKEESIAKLIEAHAYLRKKKEAYDESAAILKLTTYPPYKEDGVTCEDLCQDIELRVNIISNKKTLDKIKEFEKRAQELMSENDKKEKLAQDLAKFAQGIEA